MGKRVLVVAIALLLAGASVFTLMQYTNNLEADIRKGEEVTTVFRAVAAIAEGTPGSQVLTMGPTAFVESEEQIGDLPGGAITSRDDLQNVLSGRIAVGPMSQNSIFVVDTWAVPSVEITPLVDLIENNMEAVTVAPDVISGLNGFVRPGDLVNIIVTISMPIDQTAIPAGTGFGVPTEQTTEGTEAAAQQVQYTRRILAQVPVLAVGQVMVLEDGAPVSVVRNAAGQAVVNAPGAAETAPGTEPVISTVFTLALSPEDVERLIFAQSEGVLYFTLPALEYDPAETRGIALVNLFGRGANVVDDIFGD